MENSGGKQVCGNVGKGMWYQKKDKVHLFIIIVIELVEVKFWQHQK